MGIAFWKIGTLMFHHYLDYYERTSKYVNWNIKQLLPKMHINISHTKLQLFDVGHNVISLILWLQRASGTGTSLRTNWALSRFLSKVKNFKCYLCVSNSIYFRHTNECSCVSINVFETEYFSLISPTWTAVVINQSVLCEIDVIIDDVRFF